MEKTKAIAYRDFVKKAQNVFNLLILGRERNGLDDLKRYKETYQPEEFKRMYSEFEAELSENCLKYKNVEYIKALLKNVFQNVEEWFPKKFISVDDIISSDYEVEFRIKLMDEIQKAMKDIEMFAQKPYQFPGDRILPFYNYLITEYVDIKAKAEEIAKALDTIDETDEVFVPDPRFDFNQLKAELDTSEMSSIQKLEYVNLRLYDFLQWQKQYDTYNEWTLFANESKFQITNEYYPNFEKLCRLEIDRWNSMLAIKTNEPTAAQSAEIAQKKSYKIASKRKTDVIKILSAMYDCRMFVDDQGKPVTNKQELMEAFGEFLGEDFKAYSTLLSQAKDKEHNAFYRPFDQTRNAITE
jgi:hypothetical protein